MKITKHGYCRFKERLKIKNLTEMDRKAELAFERGKISPRPSRKEDTKNVEFDGKTYVFGVKDFALVTVFESKRTHFGSRRWRLERIREKEDYYEIIDALATA